MGAICGHSVRTLGLCAIETVRAMLRMQDMTMAQRVKKELFITEKRWWFLMMSMYSEEGRFEKLTTFIDENCSKKKPPPVGWMAVIEHFLENEQMESVKKYVA